MAPDEIASDIIRRATNRDRLIAAIAGPPGAGKSTIAESLRQKLLSLGTTAEVLPMDGFHMDNGILEERGLVARKGAPETFDVRGFGDILKAVREARQEVLVPVFDRSREIAIGSARAIPQDTRIVLVEGNYLLLDRHPWSGLIDMFDLTLFIAPPEKVLQERLRARWVHYGLDEAGITAKLEGNDMPNARFVLQNSRPAEIRLSTF